MGTKPFRGGYLPINGLNLYHEVYGELSGELEVLVPMVSAFLDDVSPKTPELF